MPRHTDYVGAGPDLDAAVAALRAAGTNPAAVSVACALAWHAGELLAPGGVTGPDRLATLASRAGLHTDCDGTLEAARSHAGDYPPCRCPAAGAVHRAGHPAPG